MVLHGKALGHAKVQRLPIDASAPPAAVLLTQISAQGMPSGGTRDAVVSFALAKAKASARIGEARTSACGGEDVVSDLTYPTWADEMVSLDAATAAQAASCPPPERPLELTVQVWDDATLLGSANLRLESAAGRVDGLDLASGEQLTSPRDAPLQVSFTFRIPGWIEADLTAPSPSTWSAVKAA